MTEEQKPEEQPKARTQLSFETEYLLGLLPTEHVLKNKTRVPFHELDGGHLYMAWNWFFTHDRDSYVYKALQREKERRHLKLPVPTENPPPAFKVDCPLCGKPMTLRSSSWGRFWGCSGYPKCKSTHGAHADGRPKGIPGTPEDKAARIKAHIVFDQLWQPNVFLKRKPLMKRKESYAWLQKAMGLSEHEAHIGMMKAEQCEKVIELVTEFLKLKTEEGK